ncbi:MAG: peptide chain release factor N(5)-glutamine methyltransferase [Phycisphaeraceae bacterium]|nr:peptide chain release factor N(5)-glutamine methyltransferase [Phycisphaeraceae bacterium]
MAAKPQKTETWTTRKLLRWTTEYFQRRELDHARLSAEMLLAHVLGVERLRLYMDADRPASELERAAFRELVERAAAREPVDYLVGQSPFFSMMFKVSPSVLIPRPSTETLVEHIIQHARRTPGFHAPTIADIGTGSGIIAIALARNIPDCRITATDISPEALEIATANAKRHGVADRIDFRQGNLLAPLAGERYRYLVSNPPYIPDSEWEQVDDMVRKYEPHLALRGGADGLDLVRKVINCAPEAIKTPGVLAVEVAAVHETAVLSLAEDAGLKDPQVLKDHEGLPRVLVADHG